MKKLLVITGPTATGKTDLAIELAQELKTGVVSADSRQVYAGMNVGTATPLPAYAKASAGRRQGFAGQEPHGHLEPDIIDGIPHYLFNIRRPDEPLSLSEWQAAAFSCIDHLHEDDLPAVLVGGTMLYIDSIVKNYDLPRVEPNQQLRQELEARAVEDLYAQLLEKDPAAQDFIEPGNKRRIIRALEVMVATSRPFSEQRRQRPPRYAITMIGLFDSWEALQQRIEKRIEDMLANGLLEETEGLITRYGKDLPLLQTMNYKQSLQVIAGAATIDQARTEMVRANFRYARRQMSWWRGREEIRWFDNPDASIILDYVNQRA